MEGAVMTDHQLDAILDMVDLILDGCKSVKEAQEKIRRIKKNPGAIPEANGSGTEYDRSDQAE